METQQRSLELCSVDKWLDRWVCRGANRKLVLTLSSYPSPKPLFSQGLVSNSSQHASKKAQMGLILAFFKQETLGFLEDTPRRYPKPHWSLLTQKGNTLCHLFLANLMAVRQLFFWKPLSSRCCLRLQTYRLSEGRRGRGGLRWQLSTEGRHR